MADADEDVIPRSRPGLSTTDPDADPEDEAQDFRFLAALTGAKSSGPLPKRGEKDFEPNPTQAQSNTLAASREAMHNALSVERVLPPRNTLVGQYLPDPMDWRWDVTPLDGEDTRRGKGGRCVVVGKFTTTYAKNIGVEDYRGWNWLLPEEALFLIERGTLEIRWPDDKVRALSKGSLGQEGVGEKGNESDDEISPAGATAAEVEGSDDDEEVSRAGAATLEVEDPDVNALVKDKDGSKKKRRRRKIPLQVGEMPMSLQGAYASFIGKSGLTLERYIVYAGLRRLGYVVLRAPTWDEGDSEDKEQHSDHHTNGHTTKPNGHITQPLLSVATAEPPARHLHPAISLINRLVAYLFTSKPPQYCPSQGPLIYPGLYRNYNDIFRALTLIPYYPPNVSASSPQPKPKPPFVVAWNVHKPNTNTKFRKSAPPPPDFRVAVLDARATSVPTASEIGALLDSMPEDQLPKEKRMEMRMKHGVRNVVLGVVDCGVVSYIRLADMCSGSEGRVIETKAKAGVKKGGGWKRGGGAGSGRGGRR